MKVTVFQPKLLTVLREGYGRSDLAKDLVAGIVVGVVALPLAIAFAISSGVKPEQGLYTAIIAGFIISVFSGSRYQIGGPTGAFIVLVYGVVQKHGYEGLAVATFMAGIFLIIMGLTGLGSVIRYIPFPVTVGFTAGIALIILISQLRDFFGLGKGIVPADTWGKIIWYAHRLPNITPSAVLIGILTIFTMILWSRLKVGIPGTIPAILLTTVFAWALGLNVETIGDRFGSIPSMLPSPVIPAFSSSLVMDLLPTAVSIALLGGIESLLSAVVADGMTGRRHRPNTELIAQGLANMASPVFMGIPATGAIARTATNISSGARSPFAGVIHATVLLIIMILLSPMVRLIPMSTLAGILIIISIRMSDWRLFLNLMNGPRGDMGVLIVTFILTVILDITVAIQVGVVLASLLFMRRMADVATACPLKDLLSENGEEESFISEGLDIPDGVEVYEINGPFFFGAAEKFKTILTDIEKNPSVLVLRMRNVTAMDITGARALKEIAEQYSRKKGTLIISAIQSNPRRVLASAGVLELIGYKNICPDIRHALERARNVMEERDEKR